MDCLQRRIDVASDPKDGTEEIRRLQGCINDLISLQTLPAIWDGRESGSIVSTLLDVLASVLRLDFAYVRLSDSINGSPMEFLQLAQRRAPQPQASEIGRALDRWLANESVNAPLVVPNPAGDGEVKIVPFRLGLTDEIGVLVASSKRANFPTPTETLLLRMAANQALVALQEARQLHEQKRAAEELERRVADRTAQLTAANEALSESEKKYRTLFDSIDEGFCTIEVLFDENDHPIDYRFLEVNPSFEKQTGIQNARGRRMREIAPNHEEHWFEIYGRIALTGEPVRFENQAAQLHRWYDAYAFRVGEPEDRKVAVLFNDITEQRQSQEAMRAAKARFEGILAIAEDAIISVDSKQHIILFNQGGEKVFGYFGNEVMGKPLDILLPQRFVHPHRGHIEEFAKSSDVSRSMAQRREVFGRRKDGSEFPAEASVSKLALGNEVVFTVILRDITERKKAEAALRRNETHLAEAQRLSKTGSWVWNAKTKENVFWSKQLLRIYGFDPETSHAQYAAARERVHPEDGSAFDETFHQALREERDFEMDHRIVLPGGEVKHIHVVGHPVLDGSSELVEYIGTVLDVTEQVEARAALEEAFSKIKQSESRLRTIIDTIPALAWSTEPDGSVEFVNRRWSNFTGLTIEQARGSGWQAAIHPEDVGWLSEQRRITMASGKPFELEARLRRYDGQYRWFISRAEPLLDEQGRIVKWYGTNTDIDDRKRAEEALRRAQAELTHLTRITTMGELAASIAHEVNQPLTAVVNNANACLSLLPNGTPHLEEVREALTEILDDTDRASAVITRVRQLAKKAPSERIFLDLRDVITDILALARYESATRRVTIRTELPNELPCVSGDRVQLQQVLLNLVMNGMDAMSQIDEAQRVLIIGGRRETQDGVSLALVSVQDSGSGFKPEEMDRLFEAFYTTKPQGMGMGLAISRSIIEAHGGRLWAEPNQGPGATFSLSLPAAPEHPGEGGPAARWRTRQRPRIL
jgi:PAS domain S-box-containing protein